MNKRSYAVMILAAALVAVMAAQAYAAIGIYKWPKQTQSVPATITYMLNTDADDASGAWAVKIDICPVQTGGTLGTPVRSYTFPAGDPMCTRGPHSIVWDGYLADETTEAPHGTYRAVITAKAAAVPDSAIKSLWEIAAPSGAYKDAAVNTNPNSDYYGYVYAVHNGTKEVYYWTPDGLTQAVFAKKPSDNWYNSSPWGIDVVEDDSVYVSNFSTGRVYKFDPIGATAPFEIALTEVVGATTYTVNPRFIVARGTGADFELFATHHTPSDIPTTSARTAYASGDPVSVIMNRNIAKWPLMEPKFLPNGNLLIPAYVNASSNAGGALTEYDVTGALINENPNIRRGHGLAIVNENGVDYVYISRYVNNSDVRFKDNDDTAVYKIPLSAAFTANPDLNIDTVKLAFETSATSKRAYTLDPDALGNLVATAGNASAIVSWDPVRVGLYAPPDNGSTDTRTSADISWTGDSQPVFISATNGTLSNCVAGSTATITVQASDAQGCTDMQAFVDLTQFAGGAVTPMDSAGCVGTTETSVLTISVPASTPAGVYTVPVYIRDTHYPIVPQAAGEFQLTVLGGTISGQVTVDVTGWPVPNAIVKATDGVNTFTGITDGNGNYSINASPGTYTVNAEKGTGYAQIADNTPVVVTCGATSIANRKLGPVNVVACTVNNHYQFPGRNGGEDVCVRAVVMRAPAIAGVQQGFDGYYYVFDTKTSATVQSVKILNWTGSPAQPELHEGDEVIVQGTWMFPFGGSGYYQGHVVPMNVPYVVSTDNPGASPTPNFTYAMRNYNYGRLFKASGMCKSVGADRFVIRIPTSATDPTLEDFTIVLQSPASTGVTMPTAGSFVEVVGVLSHLESFAQNVLCPGKASDVMLWPEVTNLGAAKALPEGGVIINCTANPMIITHVESTPVAGGLPQTWFYVESADRSGGIKVNLNTHNITPTFIWPGDTVEVLKGRLQRTNDDRELFVTELPTTFAAGSEANIPKPIGVSNLAVGGGWLGGTPPVSDRGIGTNNQGLLATVYGRVTHIENDPVYGYTAIVFIDDGSAVQGAIRGDSSAQPPVPPTPYTGLKCYVGTALGGYAIQPSTLSVGDYVSVTGIIGSEWIADSSVTGGGYRIRCLRMRYCFDTGGMHPEPLYDVFNIIEDL